MVLEPRESAVIESYPTFWTDDTAPEPQVQPLTEEAYSTFINISEDELPEDTASEAD